MGQSDQISVLLVEDDEAARANIAGILDAAGMSVEQTGDGPTGLNRAGSGAHDVVILDRMLPHLSGIDIVTRMRLAGIGAPVLMLSALGRSEHRVEGLESGVDDYLAKPFEPRELLLGVGTILRRTRSAGGKAASGAMTFGGCEFNPQRGELRRDGQLVRLTTCEVQLLRIFAAHPGQTISRLDLCENEAAQRSIDVQINRLRRKVEDDPRNPLYLQTVRGEGYVLMPD